MQNVRMFFFLPSSKMDLAPQGPMLQPRPKAESVGEKRGGTLGR